MADNLRIAFVGQKGVPATHGGVERHVEELGSRLVALGHDVTVFTRPNYAPQEMHDHLGMRLVSIPTIGTKHLDAIVHSLLSTLACWGGGYDVVHYHAIGPCLVSPLARARGRTVVATVHGQDWRRGKWGGLAARILRLGEWMALRVPHATISVSETLSERYLEEDGRATSYIPNGISIFEGDDTDVLRELGVEDGAYLLYAGRIVPEKGLHHLLEAHAALSLDMPLVVAGDTSFSDDYLGHVRSLADDDVRWAGYIYGDRLAALFRHAALFILPSDLEGLPIVLLEALGYGVPVLASDIPPNVEVLGENGQYFSAGDATSLAWRLEACLADVQRLRDRALSIRESALREYDWDRVAEATEAVYRDVVANRTRPRR